MKASSLELAGYNKAGMFGFGLKIEGFGVGFGLRIEGFGVGFEVRSQK